MKRIRLWLVLLLNVITLGVYPIFWFIRRRSEIVRKYHREIPHWWWLVAPLLVMIGSFIALMVVPEYDASDGAVGIGLLLFFLEVVTVWIIYIWWTWKFSKAAAYVTGGRAPAGWLLALSLITGGVLMTLFAQYYFNRAEPAAKLKDKPAAKPSRGFIALALTAMIMLVASGVTLVYLDGGFDASLLGEERRASYEKAERLLEQHSECVNKMERDYPEITADNYESYRAAFDACEQIRVEQNEAVDRFYGN